MREIMQADSEVSAIEVIEDEHVLRVDLAACGVEDAARMTLDHLAEGKSRVVVLGNAGGKDRVVQRLLEELEPEYEVVRDYFGQPRTKRVGVIAGQMRAISTGMALSTGPGYPMSFYAEPVTYFDYRQHLRDEEVDRQTRRPPKKAVCSSRRRGRKFKG